MSNGIFVELRWIWAKQGYIVGYYSMRGFVRCTRKNKATESERGFEIRVGYNTGAKDE